MTAVKEKIIGAVTVMTDAGAESFWHLIEKKYSPSWDDIAEEDPDCHEFTGESGIQWDL